MADAQSPYTASYACFELSITDKIAHIELTRPEKRNAMNAQFWTDFPDIIRDIDDHARARVIVISARGPVFSAGMDLSMLTEICGDGDKNKPDYGARFYDDLHQLQASFTALEQCRIPIIACLDGGALGAGVDMITACDMRFGTQNAFISIFEINVGMTADLGTFPRILNHLPEGIVRELAYTGREMKADECERRGILNAVFDSDEAMMKAVMKMAKDIAAKPPLAIYGCKRAIGYGRDHSTKDALDNIAIWNMSMLSPSEMMEAMQAKSQKRAGHFAELPKRSRKD